MFITIIIFLLILSVLVLAHEFGHFFTARRCGVKAEEFGLGFPPRAVGWYRDQKKRWHCLWGDKNPEGLAEDIRPADTIYSLNWLPIGGFVKIKGENGDGAEETDSFASKKVGRRALILSAGVIMNIILAFVLFSACYMIGAPQSVDSGGRIEVTELVKDSPAKAAGILSGDVITGADDQTFGTIPQLQDYIGTHGTSSVALHLTRQGQALTITVKPALQSGRGIIGVGLDQVSDIHYSFFKALWEGLKHTFVLLWMIIVAFVDLIRNIFVGVSVSDTVGGPVRIAQMTGEVARFGFVNLLNFTALLSLNLAVINFLPFPALDGGRIFFLILEKIRKKPVNRNTEALVHNIGFFILIALIILVTYKDIVRMF